ncbi:MAG: hypothetical protein CM1200mP35_07900 [Chloroflexota bacterium]|nr:MAG: hypothetical protein CM1200mP35_07900 [Chloroflexota bacterium]
MKFGSRGDGEGEFKRPTDVTVDNKGADIRSRLGQ